MFIEKFATSMSNYNKLKAEVFLYYIFLFDFILADKVLSNFCCISLQRGKIKKQKSSGHYDVN